MPRITQPDPIDNVTVFNAEWLQELKDIINTGYAEHYYDVASDDVDYIITVPFDMKDNIRVYRNGIRLRPTTQYERVDDTHVKILEVTAQDQILIEG